jgi:hypothetical protein
MPLHRVIARYEATAHVQSGSAKFAIATLSLAMTSFFFLKTPIFTHVPFCWREQDISEIIKIN